jgi:hypothetical protein
VLDFVIDSSYTAINQAEMKGTDTYDGAVMIFLNNPLIILLWEAWMQVLGTEMFVYWFAQILGRLLTYLSTPTGRS